MKTTKIIARLSISDYAQSLFDYFGYHFPLQLVVIGEGGIDRNYMDVLNGRCLHSSLGKIRRKSLFFGARDYWVPLPPEDIPPVHIAEELISENELLSWLNAQIDLRYEMTTTAGWKISAANLDNGRYVISFIVRHQLVDGVGALEVIKNLLPDNDGTLVAHKRVTWWDDVKDCKKCYKKLAPLFVIKKFAQLALAFKHQRYKLRWAKTSKMSKMSCTLPVIADTSQTVVFDSEHFTAIAQKNGGTATQLGFALSANIANAILGTRENKFLTIPVKGIDKRLNSVKDAVIDLHGIPSPIIDLTGIKKVVKQAYTDAQVKIDWKNTWCFHSNVGAIPEESYSVFPGATHIFGKTPLWSSNDRFMKIYQGGVTIATSYKNTFTYTFISLTPIDSEDFYKIIDNELWRFGLESTTIIR